MNQSKSPPPVPPPLAASHNYITPVKQDERDNEQVGIRVYVCIHERIYVYV